MSILLNSFLCVNCMLYTAFYLVKEILEQVMVKNLDTGEAVPLSVAEEKLPKCTNPLALQIMRLTSEYSR